MARPRRLSAAFVRTVKDPGRYGDGYGGHGLSLLVKPTKRGAISKTWSQKLRIDGQPFMIGLGVYPVVTLSGARAKALANRREIERGRDPRQRTPTVPTFREAAERVIDLRAKSWKKGSRQPHQWRQSLRDYADPVIGDKRVGEVTTADVLAVLTPIWSEKPSTARLVRTRIGTVMKWAVAKGYREDNPAGDAIGAALPRNGGHVHHQAARPDQVAGILAAAKASTSQPAVKLALRFLALTAVRVSEAVGARWSEIDLGARMWTIPPQRMKGGKQGHRVPLSRAALDVLDEARELRGAGDFVFPSKETGRGLHPSALGYLLRKLGATTSAHGLRSTFRNWAGEQAVDRQVAEACLAHTVRGVEGAYLRSDFFERRHAVMEDWGAFVDPG